MSQNSLVLATTGTLSGLAAVEAINAALDTLNTLASGASAPSSPEAGQFWHDTTNNLLKLRSQDGTAWITIGTLDETNHLFNAAAQATPTIYGLTLSNDTTTPATLLDIAPGGAFDSTAAFYMRLAAATKKNVTASWAAGMGNGSLDTGSVAAGFYHVHLIYNASSGSTDVLTSLSYSNPTLPSGYGYSVPIGAIRINTSGQLYTFKQKGSTFVYTPGVQDYQEYNPTSTTSYALALTVPGGAKLKVNFRAQLFCGTGGPFGVIFSDPDEGTQSCSIGVSSGTAANASLTAYDGGSIASTAGEFTVYTNTSAQIMLSANNAGGGYVMGLWTRGFDYPRGLQ